MEERRDERSEAILFHLVAFRRPKKRRIGHATSQQMGKLIRETGERLRRRCQHFPSTRQDKGIRIQERACGILDRFRAKRDPQMVDPTVRIMICFGRGAVEYELTRCEPATMPEAPGIPGIYWIDRDHSPRRRGLEQVRAGWPRSLPFE